MLPMKSVKIDKKLLDRIISAAYKDSPLRDRLFIKLKAARDPEVRMLYHEYQTTARSVHRLGKEACPESITSSIEKLMLGGQKKTSSFLLDIYGVVFSKPLYSAAMILVIVSAAVLSVSIRQKEQPRPYTQKQIALASQQASETLRMVGGILNETKSTVIREVLTEQVSKPINQSLSIVKNLIDKENKDEKIN